jgi:hypothetical protein
MPPRTKFERHGRLRAGIGVSRCGPTGKRIFRTPTGALLRAGEIHAGDPTRPSHWRPYRCNFCGGFHLTTKA